MKRLNEWKKEEKNEGGNKRKAKVKKREKCKYSVKKKEEKSRINK